MALHPAAASKQICRFGGGVWSRRSWERETSLEVTSTSHPRSTPPFHLAPAGGA